MCNLKINLYFEYKLIQVKMESYKGDISDKAKALSHDILG